MFSFIFKKLGLRQSFLSMFPVWFYDGEQGAAAGGASSPAPDDGAGGPPANNDFLGDIPAEALNNDEELKGIIDEEKKASGKKPEGEDKSGIEDVAGGDGATADSGAGEGDGKKESEGAEGKNSDSEEDDLSDVEFEDDVIKGLKAEHLKALPKEALAALADYHGEHKTLSEEAAQAKESLSKLLADPVVRRRQELQKSGKSEFEVRGITETEKKGLIGKLVEKMGLDQNEAEAVFDIFKSGIDDVVKEAANDKIQNLLLEDDRQRHIADTQKKGRQLFLEIGKFNKDLSFKETDASKFWNDDGALNEKHPEAKRFQEKIVPIMQSLAKAGMSYDSVVKMNEEFGPEAVYALAAKKLGLSLAINTAERDKKIIASEVRKKLAPFMKGSSVSELSVKGGTSAPSGKKAFDKAVVKDGYDIKRLASDTKYYADAIESHPERMAHINELSEEGESLLEKESQFKK